MIKQYMSAMGVKEEQYQNGDFKVSSPIDGAVIGNITLDSVDDVNTKIANAKDAFKAWRTVPAPQRGELIRLLGEVLREHKEDLGMLVSFEAGKIKEEGLGEVQEMIDICDFAVGVSRQLYGLTIASERHVVSSVQTLSKITRLTLLPLPLTSLMPRLIWVAQQLVPLILLPPQALVPLRKLSTLRPLAQIRKAKASGRVQKSMALMRPLSAMTLRVLGSKAISDS